MSVTKRSLARQSKLVFAVALAAICNSQVSAKQDASQRTDLFEMSVEGLMDLQLTVAQPGFYASLIGQFQLLENSTGVEK